MGAVEKIKDILKWLGKEAVEFVYPSSIYCICCGNIIDQTRTYSLCDHCMDHIGWNLDEPRMVDNIKMIKCVDYGIYERPMIFSLKYNKKRYLARHLAEIMRDRMEAGGITGDYLVPVPLHPKKQRQRGFNQAEVLARHLSRLTGIPVADCLLRTRYTTAMRGLGPEERAENIRESMELKRGRDGFARGKTVILIDDFFTTGSTARECVRALEKSEAEEYIFLAFAAR